MSSAGLVLTSLALARFLVGLTSIPELLRYSQELSSPLTSFLNLQEGIYLFTHGIDPYSGGTFRHSPLFLSFFSTVLPTSRIGASLIWSLCDATAAWALIGIWRSRQRVATSSRDALIAAAYLLNPYILLPSLALSTSSFENTLILISLKYACEGSASLSLLPLAFASHLSLSDSLLLPAVLMILVGEPVSRLASPRRLTSDLKRTVPYVGEYILYFFSLTVISTLISGNLNWISQTWGASLTVPDLTPNTGFWWYFFTEMFDHFRPFFLMVFSMHLVIYVAPLCIKFQYDPLYAAFLMLGILGTFKSYTTLSDPGLFASMIAVFPEIYPYLRHPIVTTLLHLHASLLLPLFNHLWINQGTGNANFFYASTLVFACANGAAVVDCIWAGLRIAIGGEPKPGYVVTQE